MPAIEGRTDLCGCFFDAFGVKAVHHKDDLVVESNTMATALFPVLV